jgi:hypothetical protein
MALRAFDFEDLRCHGKKKREIQEYPGIGGTLAPLAASPAGTVTFGSGLDITSATLFSVCRKSS